MSIEQPKIAFKPKIIVFYHIFFCGDLKVTNGFRLDDQTKNRRFNKWIFEI